MSPEAYVTCHITCRMAARYVTSHRLKWRPLKSVGFSQWSWLMPTIFHNYQVCTRTMPRPKQSPIMLMGHVSDAPDHLGHSQGSALGGVRPLRFVIVHAPRPSAPATNTSSAAS